MKTIIFFSLIAFSFLFLQLTFAQQITKSAQLHKFQRYSCFKWIVNDHHLEDTVSIYKKVRNFKQNNIGEFTELLYQDGNMAYYETAPVALKNGNIMIFLASYDPFDLSDDSLFYAVSSDGGETWSNKILITHSPFNSIYFLTALQLNSGRIIACWTNYDSTSTTKIAYSDNNGYSWSFLDTLTSAYPSWYPSISQSGDSTIYLSYSRDINENYNDIVCRTSHDNGLNWGSEKVLSNSQTSQSMGSIIQLNGSYFLAIYSRIINNSWGIVKRTSTDSGDSWSDETILYDSQVNDANIRVIRIKSDTLCLLFCKYDNAFDDVYYMISEDNGNSWNEPIQYTFYKGMDGWISNLCLYNGKPFTSFASDRWQRIFNLPHVWYGTIGITKDSNPPPAILNSAAYQHYFEPGKVETLLGYISDESGIKNVQVNLSVNDGPEYPLQMFDDGTHNDWGFGDGIYGVPVGPFLINDKIDYNFTVTDIDNNTINVKYFTAVVIQHGKPINPNKGFEETPAGIAGNNITGWYLEHANNSAEFRVVNDSAIEGKHALKIVVSNLGINPWNIQAVNEPFPVEGNAQYRFFIWAKADKENVKANFDVEDPSYNVWQGMEVNLTTKWEEYSFDFYVPPCSTQGRSANWFGLNSNSSSLPVTFYIDDLRIEKLGAAISAIDGHSEVPENFSLNQNYPNPFNPVTILSFVIGHTSFVTLRVFDLLGKEVATLVNEEQPAGDYQVKFDASNLSSGVYFYKIETVPIGKETGGFIQIKKMILLR